MSGYRATPCPQHADCVRMRVVLAAGPAIFHLGRDDARSLSRQMYYATIDDRELELSVEMLDERPAPVTRAPGDRLMTEHRKS